MQTARILQAVILMMIVAMAASCAASKEYTSKLFAPRTQPSTDSQLVAVPPLRFLEMDSAVNNQEGWVSTDIIMGRDTASNTIALDNLSKTFPANPALTVAIPQKDTLAAAKIERKQIEPETAPVAKAANPGEVRTKRSREK